MSSAPAKTFPNGQPGGLAATRALRTESVVAHGATCARPFPSPPMR
jgi:hypothetical protein